MEEDTLASILTPQLAPALLVLLLAATGSTHAAGAGSFYEALQRYQDDDAKGCADALGAMYHNGERFPDGGELLLVECTAATGDHAAAMAYVIALLGQDRLPLEDLLHKDRPGLNALRAGPEWPRMLARAEAMQKQRAGLMDEPLRRELLDREARDQAAQHAAIADGGGEAFKGTAPVAKANAEWLKTVIAEKGWPTRSKVGRDGAKAAWLLVQHADQDPDFQAQVLPLIEHAAQAGEADRADVALLTDRVLVAQGKPQRYGSQFVQGDDGAMQLRPTEDMPGLDARRSAMGLPSLAEYKAILAESYGKPVN
ncbi:hypothetical protein I5U59_12605 [Stenotrophomonas maltophilia]|uniref:Sel1 repeat family protein n=1 Tax=Stenotrophomonas forensis TaxID=2871169 RepID=A0ABY7Y1K5_9GAMM|nr:hypothetical protein VN11_00880 [Stenotrophomonas maltophilia]WDM63863.1 hypothetical protein K5L94_00750 [Stenotrophomonas sp. DFS-20110405]MBH1478186.1 hypothetical protein [Stenotrophomonas maltophilia]MBH1503911.1 hypothetical protein [Stenotrophomonas maltophilia]MBH1787960.1 hypothetical protein [Stenotrophomonas maltophilia]